MPPDAVPEPAAAAVARGLRTALASIVVGQESVIDELLAAWLAGGHVLIEGVPGVAKTLLARSMAAALGLKFGRIQFTPDLMPADVVGGGVFDFQRGAFHLVKGPVFTQVLLADEVNRAPPKTQSGLLEAMQERQVTIEGATHPLDEHFFVMATQNPVEHEGTYPLPEAQLDRFLLKVKIGYPSRAGEREVYRRFLDGRLSLGSSAPDLAPVIDPAGLGALRATLRDVHVDDKVQDYLHAIVAATRATPHLPFGASPRAGMSLLAVARARAAMEGRAFAIPDDIKRMALPALRHRLVATAEAELEGLDSEKIVQGILDRIEVPR